MINANQLFKGICYILNKKNTLFLKNIGLKTPRVPLTQRYVSFHIFIKKKKTTRKKKRILFKI